MTIHELPFVRDMFDAIAPKYDLLNRLLSLRQDVRWRRKMVSAIPGVTKSCVLDVACGTGDVLLEVVRQKGRGTMVVGADFAPEMLRRAKAKIRGSLGRSHHVHLVTADALALPFQNDRFHAVTIAFGIRNVQDRARALKSVHDLLKSGGRVLVLELTLPETGPLHRIYLLYFARLLPWIGRRFSRHGSAYRYLPESVMRFPTRRRFSNIMRRAGFVAISYKKLSMGIATLFIGKKP